MNPRLSPARAQLILHFTVFIWGFTAILGKLITLNAWALVWYRQWLAVLVLAAASLGRWNRLKVSARDALSLIGVGALVSAHWVCFYACIKLASVAVAVVCLATIPFFVALIEPRIVGRPFRLAELLLGLAVVGGVVILVWRETDVSAAGFVIGILSALFSALFNVFNGCLMRRLEARVVAAYELLAGATVMTLAVALVPGTFVSPTAVSASDWGWLFVLASVCTVLPWLFALNVLRTLSPFTVMLAVNLEPVYALAMAWLIFPTSERLTVRYYLGTLLLVVTIALEGVWRQGRAGDAGVDGVL